MFPIRDDNPQLRTPYITYGLIGVNALAWILLQGYGMNPTLAASVCSYGLIPGELLQTIPAGTVFQTGPGTTCVITSSPAWLTILSSMFMHGSWLHILGNMWFLWIFGGNVEDSMGPLRFLVFYLLCGAAAATLQISTNPESVSPMVGASGAIGGVMGAYLLLYPRVHVHLFIFLGFIFFTYAVPALFVIGYWFILQVISGFSSLGRSGGGVAFWAHVGGFAAGAVLVNLFTDKLLLDQHPYHGWNQKSQPTQNWHRIRRK